jgi:hypothetical protein
MSNLCTRKTIDNDNNVNGDVANFVDLNVSNNTVLNNLTVLGTAIIPGGLVPPNINCVTLTASEFIKAKNDINEYALLQTTASTDPDPNQCILSTSSGSSGLDIITLGTGKKIQMFSTECHMVAGYSVFPTLPVGISLFSNTLIQIDSITSTAIRATTSASMTCNLGLTLTGGTNANLTCGQILTLTGGTQTVISSTSSDLSIDSGTIMYVRAGTELRLSGAEQALFSTGAGGTGALTIRGYRDTTVSSSFSSLTMTGKTTASLTSLDSSLTLTGRTTVALSSQTDALTITGATTTNISSTALGLILTGGTTASLSAGTSTSVSSTLGSLTLTGGTSASLSSTSAALTLSGATTATLSSNLDLSLSATAGNVNISASQVGSVGGVIALSSLSPFGTSTNGITLTTGVGGIALSTTAGAIALTTGIGGISLGVVGGAIRIGTSLSSINVGILGDVIVNSSYLIHIISNGGSTSGGIYLNTTAANGVGGVYNWRFPAGPGSAGQVLTSQGSGVAQTWSNVATADVNNNVFANNFFASMYTLSTGGTTYNMTPASPFNTYTTASSSATIVLPNATLLPLGAQYYLNENNTAGVIAVQSFGGAAITNLRRGTATRFILVDNGTSAGTWDHHHELPSNVNWSNTTVSMPQTLNVSNTTLATSVTSAAIVTAGGLAGVNAWLTQGLTLQNGSSGSFVSILPSTATYATYNFTLPSSQGTTGQVLTSAGAGNAMTWSSGSSSAFTTPITITVPGTASSDIITALVPALTTGDAVNLVLGAAATTNDSAVIQFVNTGGTGSNLNSLNMGLYGDNLLTLSPIVSTLETALNVNSPSTADITINVLSAGTIANNAQTITTLLGNTSSPIVFGYSISRKYVIVATGSADNYYEISHNQVVSANAYSGYWRYYGRGRTYQSGRLEVNFEEFTPTVNLQNILINALQPNLSTTNPSSAVFFNFGRTISANDCVQLVWNGNLRSAVLGIFSGASLELSDTTINFNRPVRLNLTNTTTFNFRQTITPLAVSQSMSMLFGTNTTTFNAGLITYTHTGAGANSNSILLGLVASNASIRIAAQAITMAGAITTNNSITQGFSGTASVSNVMLCAGLATSNNVSFIFGAAQTSNNSAFINFTNSGGTGSATNPINLGVFGTTCLSMNSTTATFSLATVNISGVTNNNVGGTATASNNLLCAALATGSGINFNFGISANTNACGVLQFVKGTLANDNVVNLGLFGSNSISFNNVSMTLGKGGATLASISDTQITSNAGDTQTGGIYLNSALTGGNTEPATNRRGSTNIGHIGQGNSLFVGNNQERYIAAAVNANGVVNICETLTNSQFITFYRRNATLVWRPDLAVGSITFNGTVGVNYNTTSDYRLKTNIEDMPSTLSIITALRPITFQFKFDEVSVSDQTVHGFLAHEVQEIFPEAVTGVKDAIDEYGKPRVQQMDYAKLTPILTKAVQELLEKITLLETRLAVLEAQ